MRVKRILRVFFFYVIRVFFEEEILILISLCRNEECSIKLIFVRKDLKFHFYYVVKCNVSFLFPNTLKGICKTTLMLKKNCLARNCVIIYILLYII